MQSFFNDLSNRDVIKVIASFLDFVSLGNFLKTSKVINHSCKVSFSHRELSPDEISKALEGSLYHHKNFGFYDTRVINASCFYRPIEVILYIDKFHTTMEEHFYVIGGKKQGHYKWYWTNRNLGWECFYKDGRKDGVYKEYHRNGNLEIECFYKDDQKDGLFKKYYMGGKLMEESFVKDGHKSGSYKLYYENGNLKKEGFYKDGKTDGLCKSYFTNGTVKEICFYKDGKTDGLCKSYFTNGTVKEICFYENGECISSE